MRRREGSYSQTGRERRREGSYSQTGRERDRSASREGGTNNKQTADRLGERRRGIERGRNR